LIKFKSDEYNDYFNIKIILLAQYRILVKFRWLSDYIGIPGNEIADKHADTAKRIIGPHEKPAIRYLSAVKS
jgi:hypothetical protein